MTHEEKIKDRFLGCLVGLAVGDALGTTLEFTTYKEAQANPVKNIVGGGPFNLKPGVWTDDTSMALCIADSLIEKEKFDADDIMMNFISWYRNGYNSPLGYCFDIGISTSAALSHYERYGTFIKNAAAAGNGSIMRLAPIPMMFFRNEKLCRKFCRVSAEITHPSEEAIGCTIFMGWLIMHLLQSGDTDKSHILSRWLLVDGLKYGDDEQYLTSPKVDDIIKEKYLHKKPGVNGGILGGGYVISCLESALWAFESTDNFKDGALLAVNLGNDADTTGAVYGQIAGAYYGLNGIPKEWVNKIYDIKEIKNKAEKIYELSKKQTK